MIANLSDVMDGLAALASGLASNVYAYPVDSVTVPAVVVGYPTEVTFDVTFDRGADQMTLPVWLIVGKSSTKDARDRLSLALTGVANVKSAFDGAQSFGDVRVTDAAVEAVTVAGVEYLSIRFDIEVI